VDTVTGVVAGHAGSRSPEKRARSDSGSLSPSVSSAWGLWKTRPSPTQCVFFSNMGFENVGAPKKSKCDWVCSPMVGQSSGTLPARVQIMVLAPFPGFSRIYRCYALSGKRRSHRRRGATVTSGISRSAGAQSFRGAHRGRVLRTCIHRGECACVL
jgi:hypothetical protein